jgi:hypothetical protein
VAAERAEGVRTGKEEPMGFMDKFKDAAAQAQEAAKGAASGAGSFGIGDQAEYRDRAVKLNSSGVDNPATVKGLRETGNVDAGGGKEIEFDVDVSPAGGDAYTTSFKQFMVASVMEQVSEGSAITVRVDPDDPNSMMFWGLAG